MSREVTLDDVPISYGTDAATAFALRSTHALLRHEVRAAREYGVRMAESLLALWDLGEISMSQDDLSALRAALRKYRDD